MLAWLGRHLNLVLGLCATTLWVGAFAYHLRQDITEAWRAYRRRWM